MNFDPRLALKANIAATKKIKAVLEFTVSYDCWVDDGLFYTC